MTPPELLLTIRYRDREHRLRFAGLPGATLTVGRRDFHTWFRLPANALLNISKEHFTLVYDNGRFWLNEHSSYGSQVRPLDDPLSPPYKKYGRARLPLGRRTEVKLPSTHREDGSSDDVYVLIDNPAASDTLATSIDPLWDQLLRRLESGRAAHLIGLPGSGKWYLARQLLADPDDSRAHDRERALGVCTLPVSIDCRAIGPDDSGLWHAFARRLLAAIGEAAARDGFTQPAREIEGLVAEFDRQTLTRPDETMVFFQRALETVVSDALQSPLLVLTNFDAVYADLEPEMLYCLARFPREWHELSERLYVVIATFRPLALLRDDARDDFVRDFNHLFADATIVMSYSGQFRALWESLSPGEPLDPGLEDELMRLTGANPGLLRDVLRRARSRGWPTAPAGLVEHLRAEPWADAPPPTADKLWRALRPDERECLLALADGRPIDINRQQELARLGLVDAGGRVFSALFAATLGRFRDEEDRHERGLRVDEPNRRVYVDGKLVGLKDGRELDVLLALYRRRGQVVEYETLVREVYGQEGQPYDMAMFFSDKEALQRAVNRLCEKVDPQRVYLTTRHGVGYTLSAAVA